MSAQHKWAEHASTILYNSPALRAALAADGWEEDVIANTNGTVEFGVLHKTVPNPVTAAPGAGNPLNSASILTGAAGNGAGQGAGSNSPVGTPTALSTPTPPTSLLVPTSLPTLALVRRDERRLVLAVDTEFYYPFPKGHARQYERVILTWQFAFAEPDDPDTLELVVFHAASRKKKLGLGRAIAYIVERFDLAGKLQALGVSSCPPDGFRYERSRRWTVPLCDLHGAGWADRAENPDNWATFDKFEDARQACGDPDFKDAYDALVATMGQPSRHKLAIDRDTFEPKEMAGYVNEFADFHRNGNSLRVLVLCHAGKADLSAFTDADFEKDVLRQVSEVQGGLVSMQDYTANPHLQEEWWRFYPLNVSVRDTMCHAPAKMKGLDDLGVAVGVPKFDLPAGYSKDAMQVFLQGDPVSFMAYASQDTVVTLSYAGALYDWNHAMPVTASSAAVTVMVAAIKDYLGLTSNAEFNRVWRGLEKKKRGFSTNPKTGKLVPMSDYEPINDQARRLQEYARNAFKGGANGCSEVGWIEGKTSDIDLCSAYPTLMSLVFDIDWEADKCITREWVREDATLQDFHTPFDPAFAYVDAFEFPPEIPYPCIAVNLNGRITFPRTLGALDGVYCTGIEIWLALKLGAHVHIQYGCIGKYRLDASGKPTHSLFEGVKAFVQDRAVLKAAIESGQTDLAIYEQNAKTMVNSVYGKTAQNIVEKETWDSYSQRMVSIGSSRITSPTHASMITAGVRCVLMAAMNELYFMPELHPELKPPKRYKSYSFTTDGFITDADEATANNLDLMGLMPYLRAARMALVGDDIVWEAKHHQEAFYNLTTRGNMAPNPEGVIAHNSYISPHNVYTIIDKDKRMAADREHCLKTWLSRTGRCDCTANIWSRFKDMADKHLREDFHVTESQRHISMDFDMKRKPVEASLTGKAVELYGDVYEVANVSTVPFDTPEEAEFYHSVAKGMKCLRTVGDWELFFFKVRNAASGVQRHVSDLDWSRLFTCVMGHRLGVWCIPTLDDDSLSVEQKCDWVNQFNTSKKPFTPTSWKNARKQNRQSQMLPRDEVEDLLIDMGAITF